MRRRANIKPQQSKSNIPATTTPNLPAKNNGSIVNTIGSGIASGMGVGIGLEAARGLGNAIFGGNDSRPRESNNVNINTNQCKTLFDMFESCSKMNNDPRVCQDILENYKQQCIN